MATKIADLAKASQKEVTARFMAAKVELESIQAKGDARTPEDIEASKGLIAEMKELKEHSKVFETAKEFDGVLRDANDFLTKPVGGFPHVHTEGKSQDDKGVDTAASRFGLNSDDAAVCD